MICDKCGTPMRWPNQQLTDHPGTTSAQSKTRCRTCSEKHGGVPRKLKPDTFTCAGECGRTLRNRSTRKADYPDTPVEVSAMVCGPCYQAKRNRPNRVRPKQSADPNAYPDTFTCVGPCGRTLRPGNRTLEERPNTVAAVTLKRCQRCLNYEMRGSENLLVEAQTLSRAREKRAAEQERIRVFEETHVMTRYGVRKKAGARK